MGQDKRSGLLWRFFGLLMVLAVASGGGLVVGSVLMRSEILDLVAQRTLESFATVMGKPFELSRGLNIKGAKLLQRLQRTAYQEVELPQAPGQYSLQLGVLRIYLRAVTPLRDLQQEAMEVALVLNSSGEVTEIRQLSTASSLRSAWLEPELISLLGNSEERYTDAKTLAEFSKKLIAAVVAIEDERFFSHFGLDLWAILRAVVTNIRHGQLVQGGSTISQQLAKNLLHGQQRTLGRKIKEAFSALLIESAFSKNQILEMYLNEIFLAQEGRVAIHGFGGAARSFFGKDVADLTWGEAALLAGLIRAPSGYSPRRNLEKALERKDVVLRKLYELEALSAKELQRAQAEKIEIKPAQHAKRLTPHYIDYLRQLLSQAVPLDRLEAAPLQIHTGIDVEYQLCAENAVRRGLSQLEKTYPRLLKQKEKVEAALLSVFPSRGEIVAWVGSRDYKENQFDHVNQAKRQSGSAFKPFVYLTALDGSLNNYRVANTTSLLLDQPASYKVAGYGIWEPQNYDKEFRGEVSLRDALTYSLNVPTVEIAMKVGIDRVANTASLLGLSENLPQVPAIALGAAEVSLLSLMRAYSVLANGGVLTEFKPINSVTRHAQRELVYQARFEEQRMVGEPAVYVLTDILRSVVERGTARSVRNLGYSDPVAGKTGTTNEARDAWFIGYTPHLLSGVWVGFDDNRVLGLTGAQAAVPIWTEYMKCVAPMEPKIDFLPPPGVVFQEVDLQTGLAATSDCPEESVVREVFVQGTAPIKYCDLHGDGGLLPGANSLPAAARALSESSMTRARSRTDASESERDSSWQRLLNKIWTYR